MGGDRELELENLVEKPAAPALPLLVGMEALGEVAVHHLRVGRQRLEVDHDDGDEAFVVEELGDGLAGLHGSRRTAAVEIVDEENEPPFGAGAENLPERTLEQAHRTRRRPGKSALPQAVQSRHE